MDIYKTNVLRDELLHCDNLEDLKEEILPKLQQQRVAWQWKIKQIMRENQYSGREMAQLCEVSVTSVRKWCKGSLPQSREMFIRIGFAAHYDIEQMNRFLQRYGRYPKLYAKSLEDSVCIFILSSETLPHTYFCYRKLLESMQANISGVEPDVQADYSTVEMEEHIINIQDEETMQRFVQEHAGEYRRAYDKLYNYIQDFLQMNRVSRVDETQMSIQELAGRSKMSGKIRRHTKIFGNWNVEEEIGEGAYSVVFRLEKSAYGIKDTSVLKVIDLYDNFGKKSEFSEKHYDEMKERVEQEVRKAGKEVALMQQLRGSTNIVDYLDFEVYDWEDEEDESYGTSLLIRMEKLENVAMEQRRGRRFTDLEIIRLGKDICSALMLCHSQKILHRDIKPDNIYRNENGCYKLGDFGVSRILDTVQSKSMRKSAGTRAYMATEEEVRRRMTEEEFPPLNGVDEQLAEAIRIACCYQPEERYKSAEQFYEELCIIERIVELEVAFKEASPEEFAEFCKCFSIKKQSEIQKEQKEFEALLQAANQGDAKAQYQVGECFLIGKKSVPCDQQEAVKCKSDVSHRKLSRKDGGKCRCEYSRSKYVYVGSDSLV